MRIWNSSAEVDQAIETIKKILEATGTIPTELIEAYQENLVKAQTRRRGLVIAFYEGLAERCPEALPLFLGREKQDEP